MKEDTVSIIIPMYNESENVKYFLDELYESFENNDRFNVELVFVDDGSTDDTVEKLKSSENKKFSTQIIRLSKNWGSHAAIRAGITKAKGNITTFLTADLQDPPSVILRLYENLKKGFDIVWAQRKTSKSNFAENFFSGLYAYLIKKWAFSNFPGRGFDIVMFSYKVKEELNRNIEGNSSIYLQILSLGFTQNYIEFDKRERKTGKSKWTLSKKIKLFIDSFVAFSYAPIRFVTYSGIGFSILGFIWTIYIVIRTIVVNDLNPGWPALMAILMIGFGITNISLGIIAEYLWRTLDSTRNRPVFIIDEAVEINKDILNVK